MSKKILAVALAAAMILGLASVAFAASFSDTKGHEREAAIDRLYGLGLIDGFGDGTFRPDESITRAQIAKLIVYAMGLKDAADMLAGVPVGFSDVPANHWASGYISVAASQGIVLGYPDGTFKPEQNVTYAEILTMILRALGYGPALQNLPWPTAYLAKAAELKINRGINFLANDFASRGDVCGLLANALTVPKLVQIGYGDSVQYVVSGTNNTDAVYLLTDMGATYEEGYLVSAPDLFGNNGTTVQLEGEDPWSLVEGYTVSGLLGHKVRVWRNEAGEVFYVEDITPANAIQTATYVQAENKLKLKDGTKLDVPGAGTYFKNYAKQNPSFSNEESVTVILEGGVVKYVVKYSYQWGVVDSVNLTTSRVTLSNNTGSQTLLLKDWDIIWSGAANSLEDLQKGDVIDYISADRDVKKIVMVVTRNAVVGTFEKLSGTTVTIDGVNYSAIASGIANSKALGSDVEALLNKDGKIVKMTTLSSTPSSDGTLAVVLAEGQGSDGFTTVYKLKLWHTDGTESVVDVASKITFNGTDKAASAVIDPNDTAIDLVPGDVIRYKTSSGKVSEINVIVDWEPTSDLGINDTLSLVAYSGVDYKVTADTVVIHLKKDGGNFNKAEAFTVSGLLDLQGTVKGAVVGSSSGILADVVVLVNAPTPASDVLYGMIYGTYQAKVGSEVQTVLRVLVEGTITDYPAGTSPTVIGKGTVIGFKVSATGSATSLVDLRDDAGDNITYQASDSTSNAVYKWRVADIDLVNNVLTLKEMDEEGKANPSEPPMYLWLSDNTLFYDTTGSNPVSLTAEEIIKEAIVDVYYINDPSSAKNNTVVVLVVKGY